MSPILLASSITADSIWHGSFVARRSVGEKPSIARMRRTGICHAGYVDQSQASRVESSRCCSVSDGEWRCGSQHRQKPRPSHSRHHGRTPQFSQRRRRSRSPESGVAVHLPAATPSSVLAHSVDWRLGSWWGTAWLVWALGAATRATAIHRRRNVSVNVAATQRTTRPPTLHRKPSTPAFESSRTRARVTSPS